MGDKSAIGWTDATWNPWRGCRKVSEGCKYCYMFRDQRRYRMDPTTVVRSKSTFSDPVRWAEGRKVFTCSWSDFFIEDADPWRDEAWGIIRHTPQHTYQILTKRPELVAGRLPADWGDGWPHVWLGVSAENQWRADERIPILLETPAAVRWISAEPLLGPLDLRSYLEGHEDHGIAPGRPVGTCVGWTPPLDWVVVGGESGPGHRPMDVAWLESIVRQCQAASVPVFVKQDSGARSGEQGRIPDDLWVHEYPA